MSEKKQKNTGSEPKKHHRLRTVIIVLVVLIIIMAAASGGSDNSNNSNNSTNSTNSVETEAVTTEKETAITEKDTRSQTETLETDTKTVETDTKTVEAETTAETEVETESGYKWDAGPLEYLGMSRDELLDIYTAYDDLYFSYNGIDVDAASAEEWDAYEDSCAEQIAAEYGISADDVKQISLYGSMLNYFATFDPDDVKLSGGELESISVFGSTINLEAKITSSWNNKMTISQNYYIVCDFIRDYAGTDYDKISYWAIADMSDGSEQKVVSFDVPKNVIDVVATQDFPDNQLGDYVTNLWVHQSLRDD